MSKDEYDGFYFLPGDEDGDINLAYFKFKEEGFPIGKPVNDSPLGGTYHIAFFRKDVNGDPMFDDAFEAVFADPSIYVKGLMGAEIYGCVLRKTENSEKWWKQYLTRAQKTCMINKLISVANKIVEEKT